MCAACVAQGIVYVGGAVGTLRVMAARAEIKRHRALESVEASPTADTSSARSAGDELGAAAAAHPGS